MIKESIIKELEFKAVRSSGPGGQHVNTVSSKVVLSFDVQNSVALLEEEKLLLLKSISSRLTNDFILNISCDENRSQFRNKELVIKRFLEIIEKGLLIPKVRKSTKPSKSSVRKKKENKMKLSVKKNLRKKPDVE